VPEDEVRAILEDAATQGVTTLDTAAVYGDIESRLVRLAEDLPFRFHSKIPPLAEDLNPEQAARIALAAARQSRYRLGPALTILMAHRTQDFQGERGAAILHSLRPWAKDEGITLGSSCYSPDEAADLTQTCGIAVYQLPGNAFDQRIEEPVAVARLAGVEVHLRSIFLQGLLLMDEDRVAEKLPAAVSLLRRWHAWTAARGLPALEAALSISKAFRSVSKIIVGVDSLHHWREVASAWKRAKPISAPELATGRLDVIDPRKWKFVS